jgi:malate dehydrogenase
MLEVESAMHFLEGVNLEVTDCAFDCLSGTTMTFDPLIAFKDADYAILFAAFPVSNPQTERKDML